jgi:sulfonate transport system permease protein
VLNAIVMPVVDAVRPVAALTVFPLLILILGLGVWSKMFVIFWTAWPPILLSTVQSIRQVDRTLLEAARLDGAGRWALLRHITLPLASPGILTGLRIGLSTGWISLVAAEMLGASRGLGYTILSSSQTFQFPTMYATIILIALIGLAMNAVLAGIQQLMEERVCAW